MVDLVPNATLVPFTWLLAGAVLGYGEALVRNRHAPVTPVVAETGKARRPRTVL